MKDHCLAMESRRVGFYARNDHPCHASMHELPQIASHSHDMHQGESWDTSHPGLGASRGEINIIIGAGYQSARWKINHHHTGHPRRQIMLRCTGVGRDDICNYHDLRWRFLILEAEQGTEADIRHQFDGYIRALISLVIRQRLSKTPLEQTDISRRFHKSLWDSMPTLLAGSRRFLMYSHSELFVSCF